MKQIALILALLITTLTQAQTINGKVTEKDSGEGLPYANVVLEKDGVQKAGTTTDLDGYYSLTGFDPGTYDLRVSYVGLSTNLTRGISVSTGKTIALNVAMESSVTLEECVVVGTRRATRTNSSSPLSGRTAGVRITKGKKHKSAAPVPSDPIPQVSNTESYAKNKENGYKKATDDPLSTFSIDVDRASYSNMRRFITQNQKPPVDAIRIEEMVNYFEYDYPQPEGEHPFNVITEVSASPWNEGNHLVHVGLQGKSIDLEKAPNSNLVFLLDVSGSMYSENKLSLLKSALKLLVDNLRKEDRVAIVVYAGSAGLVLKSTEGTKKEKIYAAIDNLRAGGSTAGAAGIQLAYKIAKENFIKSGNNRIILATDGDFNVGVSGEGELEKLIVEKREDDIFLTVLGFGMGNYQDSKMEILADKGNGNYAYIDNILEAKKVLVNEMGGTLYTIAKDVKIQVEFNPKYVASYRLIGYENRLLNKEDFNDDKKDAGELGAGHTVTALYEIVPVGKITGKKTKRPSVDPLKYQKTEMLASAEKSGEMMNVKLRYKQPKGDKSQLIEHPVINEPIDLVNTSDNFRFSAAVAAFGMLLRESKHKGKVDYELILDLARKAKGKDENGYRAEFLRLVETCDLQFASKKISVK